MNVQRYLPAVLAVLGLLAGVHAQAASFPAATIPEGVGVNIHFVRGGTQDLDLMAAAGIKIVRTDFVWTDTEPQKGAYDWSAYDELVANLEQRGLRPYFILDYSNALYEQNRVIWLGALPQGTYLSAPQHADSIAAFAAWAGAAAAHFAGHNVIWEIWNEPNLSLFWKPVPNVQQYQQLANATCNAVRAADAGATIVAPAAAGFPWSFLGTLLSSGTLNCLDGVSVHPYRTTAPETAASDFAQLQTLINQNTPAARSGQIQSLSGEWGYSTATGAYTLTQQADYAVRQQLSNLLNGVNLSVWYDWKNDGSDPSNGEHNFGLVNTDLTPKPAYTALQTMTQQLSGYRIVSRLNGNSADDYILAMANAQGQIKLAYWTAASPHSVSLVPVVGGLQLAPLSLQLTSSPQYTGVLGLLTGP